MADLLRDISIALHAPKDVCAYCRWPIDFAMGPGLNVAICTPETADKWMHSVCADHYRGFSVIPATEANDA